MIPAWIDSLDLDKGTRNALAAWASGQRLKYAARHTCPATLEVFATFSRADLSSISGIGSTRIRKIHLAVESALRGAS